jgi:hypothetical protein
MLTLGVVLSIAGWFAYSRSFIQDDAYISFCYAKHFAEGDGLVWYPGSNEFGYTSFLFTLAVGLLMKSGLTAEVAASVISVPAFFGSIAVTFLIARRTAASGVAPLLAAAALATHPTFTAFATGGMETSLQTLLILAVYYAFVRWRQSAHRTDLHWMGIVAALALFTRLDSALLLFPAYAIMVLSLLRRRCWGLMIHPLWLPLLGVAGLLAFCRAYYGYSFPTTFYAKVDSQWHIQAGLAYLASYLWSQAALGLFALGLALVIGFPRALRSRYAWLWLCPILLQIVYILNIGGDFMEYRLLLPILPFYCLLIGELLPPLEGWLRVAMTAIVATVVVSGNMIQRYSLAGGTGNDLVETTEQLNGWVSGSSLNMVAVGQSLHELFYHGDRGDVKIAVRLAGAVPYYSGLPSVDMHGLNTREVLSKGVFFQDRPGHRIMATLPWMEAQGVNLVITEPHFVGLINGRVLFPPWFPFFFSYSGKQFLLIPIGNQFYVSACYLNRHTAIDDAIQEGKIMRYQDLAKKATPR